MSRRLLALVVASQRPALESDGGHIECIYFFLSWSELCYKDIISLTLRISQKNRRKTDIPILILYIGKQNEEKSRDSKIF